VKQSAPLYADGTVERCSLGKRVPVQETRLILDYPASLPVQYNAQLLPDLKQERSEANGRVRIEFIQGPMESVEAAENYLPGDIPAYPQITFSAGASWQKIVSSYAAIVDQQIAKGNATDLSSQLTRGKTATEEKIAAILQYLSKDVRYTGIEFDVAGIVPHSPAETLKNKYDDCKDKATRQPARSSSRSLCTAIRTDTHALALGVGRDYTQARSYFIYTRSRFGKEKTKTCEILRKLWC
jgi:transglutaminase-like putative cysteine protease